MRMTFRVAAMFLAAGWLLAAGAPAAAAELCPMGGTLIVVETDREKALAWARTRTRVVIDDTGAADWSVLTLSVADEGIALLVSPGGVFFGVSGRGGETYPRDIQRAFGAGFAKLRDAVAATLADLAAARVVRLEAADIQALAGAVGLGVLEKRAAAWDLTTRNCQAVDLPASGL